jgi:CelD/BcsL family acetyltransferase involved in cellulose biosynthesis
MSDLTIEQVTDVERFRSLRESWNALLQKSHDNNPFLTWEWLFTWWQHYGGDKKLRIFVIKKSGEIIGIAPFMQSKYRKGVISVDVMENLCSERCDYSGIILADRGPEPVAILLDCLGKITRDENVIVRISQIPENSAFITMLREQYPSFSKSLFFNERVVSSCPYIDLPATWEECYHMLTKPRRKKLRKAMQSLENHEVEFKKCPCGENLREQLQVLFELHEKRWQARNIGSKFDESETQEFYVDVSEVFHQNNWLVLSFLNIDGQPASVRWGFNYNDTYYSMTAAFDPCYSDYSVGNVHLMKLIEDAIQSGLRKFDFLKGIETHKAYWTSDITDNIQITIAKRGFGGRYQVKLLQSLIKLENITARSLGENYRLLLKKLGSPRN